MMTMMCLKKRCREESLNMFGCKLNTQNVTVKFIDDGESLEIIDIRKKKGVLANRCQVDENENENEDVMQDEDHYIKNDPI